MLPVPAELTAATYTLIHVEAVLVTLPYIVLGVVASTVEYGLTAVNAPEYVPPAAVLIDVVAADQGPLDEDALSTNTLYEVIVAPPFEDGADQVAFHDKVVPEREEVAVKEVTIPGTVAPAGPTCAELASVDVPAELVAVANALK